MVFVGFILLLRLFSKEGLHLLSNSCVSGPNGMKWHSPTSHPLIVCTKRSAMSEKNAPHKPNTLTYAQAGVDIDAGNALVQAIKPIVKATLTSWLRHRYWRLWRFV